MKGWINRIDNGRFYKAWLWKDSIFVGCKIKICATWEDAFDFLRSGGAKSIMDDATKTEVQS